MSGIARGRRSRRLRLIASGISSRLAGCLRACFGLGYLAGLIFGLLRLRILHLDILLLRYSCLLVLNLTILGANAGLFPGVAIREL